MELETKDDASAVTASATSHPQRKRIPIKLKASKGMSRSAKDDDITKNLQFTTAKISSSSEPLHNNKRLRWNYRVQLIGSKIQDPMIHTCYTCTKPILLYGRMLPCKHVFCYSCATKNASKCPRCEQAVTQVDMAGLGSVFLCTYGGSKHGVSGCHRTYVSPRDLQAHINHRHYGRDQHVPTQQEAALTNPATSDSMMTSQSLQPPPNTGPPPLLLSHPSSLPGTVQFNPLQPPPQIAEQVRLFQPTQVEGSTGAPLQQMLSVRNSQPQLLQPAVGQLLTHQAGGVLSTGRPPFNQPVVGGQIRQLLISSAGINPDGSYQNIPVMSSRTNLITVPIQEERAGQVFDPSHPPPPFSSQSAPPVRFPDGSFPNQLNLPPSSSFSTPPMAQAPPFNAQIQFDPRAAMRQSAPPTVMVSLGQPTNMPPRNPSPLTHPPAGHMVPMGSVAARPPSGGLLSPPNNASSGMGRPRPSGVMMNNPAGSGAVSEASGEGKYRPSTGEGMSFISSSQATSTHETTVTSNMPPGMRTVHPSSNPAAMHHPASLRQAPPRHAPIGQDMRHPPQNVRHQFAPDHGRGQAAMSGAVPSWHRPRHLLMRHPNSSGMAPRPRQMQFYQQREPQ